MVGDPSAITATARSQEKPMLLILQTGSAAAQVGADGPKCNTIVLSGLNLHDTHWAEIDFFLPFRDKK